MDLAVRRGQGRLTIGLHQARAGDIIDLTECAVLHPALFALIGPLRAALSGLAAIRREASVAVNVLDSGADILLRTDGELIMTDRAKLIRFAEDRDVARISWSRDMGTSEAVCVLRPAVTSLSGVSITPPPGAFLQATKGWRNGHWRGGSRRSSRETNRSRRGHWNYSPAAERSALRWRAGSGVLAIEGDDALVTACHNAINQAGLMGKLEIEARKRDLARQPLLANEISGFSVVVLDPPHAGAAVQMPHIAQAKVKTVIYVSCDPVSLGRDSAVLRAAGYRLESVTPVDQFLWSARLEAVAVFRYG